jgi:DNA-binding winged helix-turn-helix (wHTH) protein/Tol biopolymer transport system component
MIAFVRDQDSSPSVVFHPSASGRAVYFGPFRFDVADRTLSRDGEEIHLPPRALAILAHLVERPQRVVTKQDLLDAAWKGAFVSESSLTEAIGVLRQALGDSASSSEYIQTVHRRGYRFTAPIRLESQRPDVAPVIVPARESDVPAGAAGAVARRTPGWRVAAVAVALVATAAAAAAWFMAGRDAPPVTRATITLPAAQAPAPGLTSQPIAVLSPDGRRIIYVAGAPGSYRLFLRAIDQFEAIPIPGTDGAHAPFFSPDGASIAFFAGGRLRAMTLPDGQPIDLAAAGTGEGGWWHTDGTIIFAAGTGHGLHRIADVGGERLDIPLSGFDGASLRHPTLLDDGRTLLATKWNLTVRHSEIVAIDIESGAVRTIARGVHARPLPDGRIIYLRDGDLVAAPLSGGGPEVSMISGIMTGVTGAGQYSLAANGTLLYLPDAPTRLHRRIARISAEGREEPLLFEPRAYQNVALSPDGTRIVATIYERGASDLWLGEIERGVFQRLTSEGGTIDPVWSPDGASIYFSWSRQGQVTIFRMPADGSSPPAIVSTAGPASPGSVARDGALFALSLLPGGGADILRIAPDGTPSPWLATPASESGARLSPDERYVAYLSDKSGRLEVYIRPVSGGPEQQVSLNGGTRPGWSADGDAILFGAYRRIHRAEFRDGRLSRPVEIYANPRMVLARIGTTGALALTAIEEERPLTTLNLIVGWVREARAR